MATGEDWTLDEVEATVADYFEMLASELAGSKPNKSERNRLLRERLHGRSHGSIEFKHQNISAVLQDDGLPYIEGYKPRGNYQRLLGEEIRRFLERHPEILKDLARSDFAVTAAPESVNRKLSEILDTPPLRTPAELIRERERTYVARKRDLAILDERRRALGIRGEEFVVWFERRRLEEAGRPKLAKDVEHVSETRGDGAGYDVKSFEEDGRERLIEVKTTTYGKHQPFIVSINEVEFSNDFSDAFHLYRLFRFGTAERIFTLKGSLRDTCNLEAVQFRATL
jgi:hypothetical protein